MHFIAWKRLYSYYGHRDIVQQIGSHRRLGGNIMQPTAKVHLLRVYMHANAGHIDLKRTIGGRRLDIQWQRPW